MHLCAQHCVTKTQGVSLSHIVQGGQVRGPKDRLEATLVPLGFEHGLEFRGAVKVIL
jgi:hypothetical protein